MRPHVARCAGLTHRCIMMAGTKACETVVVRHEPPGLNARVPANCETIEVLLRRILALAASACIFAGEAQAAQSERPNIIFILSDDIARETSGVTDRS